MPKEKGPQICSVQDCGGKVFGYGLCSKHYQRAYLYGRLSRKSEPEDAIEIPKRALDGRRNDANYNVWWALKNGRRLCREWADNYWKFANTVGERPSKKHYFAPLEPAQLIGPDNFEWREQLKRKPGETKKDWHARKWVSRRKHYPNYEANRFLKRKYGITLADYNRMKDEQQNLCAICHQPETTYEAKNHTIKGLSVDHCHKTKKVRELLCFRCNSVIGRLHDDIALLDACRAYLIKHS